MIQEEKAKRYDEALERVKESLKDGTISSNTISYIEEIFPELKESEDEKIRKALIKYYSFNKDGGSHALDNITPKQILTWLERQGQTFTQKDVDDAYLKGICDAKQELEKQGEQKPIDKVEPKFKIGDWVVYDHRAYQVVELPKEGYINLGLRRNGKIEFVPSTYCRLWTIQDAKDGNVLSYRDGQWIFIYKEIIDNSYFYYTLYSTIDQDLTIDDAAFTLLGDAITPATKEQRYILFQKMKEAGYEWDAEKKELKKIEQKPAWSEEDEKKRILLINILKVNHPNGYFKVNPINTLNMEAMYVEELIDWLKALKDRILPQSKQEWSEEDNTFCNGIISHFEKELRDGTLETECSDKQVVSDLKYCYKKNINWLKSLKDRMQPQLEQKNK